MVHFHVEQTHEVNDQFVTLLPSHSAAQAVGTSNLPLHLPLIAHVGSLSCHIDTIKFRRRHHSRRNELNETSLELLQSLPAATLIIKLATEATGTTSLSASLFQDFAAMQICLDAGYTRRGEIELVYIVVPKRGRGSAEWSTRKRILWNGERRRWQRGDGQGRAILRTRFTQRVNVAGASAARNMMCAGWRMEKIRAKVSNMREDVVARTIAETMHDKPGKYDGMQGSTHPALPRRSQEKKRVKGEKTFLACLAIDLRAGSVSQM
ncbi:hypothetical protein FISHEDRAFT_63123 [Fistulina hepatica ATCC 64428]|uniref:Uncharacterized protein n=1 Tax=Fistulina hepatica ATCC 64428 TaxID=1128425 RepID=A0A0D6ZYI7_9AGAR|nr:hypothetical protein FISHEDRAFT_63123 [Fistulina hepatica ATCC 64428]